jgi:hypothetical protein
MTPMITNGSFDTSSPSSISAMFKLLLSRRLWGGAKGPESEVCIVTVHVDSVVLGASFGHPDNPPKRFGGSVIGVLFAAASAEAIDDPKGPAYRRPADALSAQTTNDDPPQIPLPAQGPTPESMPDSVDDLIDFWDDQDAPTEPDLGSFSRPEVTLADVGGVADVKERLNISFLSPMNNPNLAEAFKKNLRGGLLLWGPPGCGKTFLAKSSFLGQQIIPGMLTQPCCDRAGHGRLLGEWHHRADYHG